MELLTVNRDNILQIRVTRGQKETVQKLADELGLSVSDYIRYCITETANRG